MLGDFVKGPVHQLDLPEAVRGGVWLHRRIDSYTDAHPLVLQSKARVSLERRRFAGILVDMFYDHLLARHWASFTDRPLDDFSRDVYCQLRAQRALMPERAWTVVSYMSEQDWLGSYAELKHLHRAVDNMARRFRRETAMPGGLQSWKPPTMALRATFSPLCPSCSALPRLRLRP
ncbi:ACP phosphodiesterase [Halopseudomonas pachastrellae]|nr:ACP phosphodiesterase [Halopseudomonas pachastrellae]